MARISTELTLSQSIVEKACEIGQEIKAKALFIYADVCPNLQLMGEEKEVFDIFLVARTKKIFKEAQKIVGKVLLVPNIPLTRMGQVKVAIMMAVSQNLLKKGDRVVCLSGIPRFGFLDTLVVIEIGKEFEMLTSKRIIDFTKDVEPKVFEEVVRLAVEIANEGREGKPVGTCFVMGDAKEVMLHVRQMVLNPFKGYPEEKRNILDPDLKETIKEFAQLDGAFVIRKGGIVETAGAFLKADTIPERLPQGWGARHYSAAAITSITNAIAITVSQSSGDVRIFKGGHSIMEIEKPFKD
jgi:DNA integrity scanning protein DisA with diadenylate cyclase activity